ncbi:MAG: hypothetical protein K2F99_03920 [Muribaculaceae bacterium]|nr:hypothetical protein [Muribaculaceae bacterium]
MKKFAAIVFGALLLGAVSCTHDDVKDPSEDTPTKQPEQMRPSDDAPATTQAFDAGAEEL